MAATWAICSDVTPRLQFGGNCASKWHLSSRPTGRFLAYRQSTAAVARKPGMMRSNRASLSALGDVRWPAGAIVRVWLVWPRATRGSGGILGRFDSRERVLRDDR